METEQLVRLVTAFVFTMSLLGLCGWLLARFGGRFALLNRNNTGGRLGVVEWKAVDHRHQLVLVRRDKAEHLILLSATGRPVVIERNISTGNAP